MALLAGTRLGPYEILEPLGAGGMGEVYRAHDARLGRDVAIKVVSTLGVGDPDRRRRFDVEARAVAALSHPNVLAVFDVGLDDEAPYLVTELLHGETLRERLRRGPLSPAATVQLMRQLVAGLTAAHGRGIVHRDLKPENLFLIAGDHLKILDFGLARRVEPRLDDAVTIEQTAPHVVLGTLDYMAPEQLRSAEVDGRADIFACGALLYEITTGRRAFRGETPADTMGAILTTPPEALPFEPSTPPGLVAVARRCLAKDPERRYQRVEELGAALEALSGVGSSPLLMPPVANGIRAIAVLPFVNMSADPANQYFSDGLSEDLLNALARLDGLHVASQAAAFRFRGPDVDLAAVGRTLGVDGVLEGSVRRSGSRLRITARFTTLHDLAQVWSGRHDREFADVFALQDEIVDAIASAVGAAVTATRSQAARRPTENLAAYELYLKGRHAWNQRSPALIAPAIRCFEDAIALDPGYALAHAGLADCYSVLRVYGWTPREHCQPRARDAAASALALDATLPEAHLAQALYTFHFEREWRSAGRAFDAALVRQPASGLIHAYVGMFLATAYQFAAARAALTRAVELDASSGHVQFLVAAASLAMNDPAMAERHARRAIAIEPESLAARWPLTVALMAQGRLDDAERAGADVLARTRAPIYVGVLALLLGRAGRSAEAAVLGRELHDRRAAGEFVPPTARLAAAAGQGDRTAAAAAIEECADGGAPPFAVVAPMRWLLDGWRDDPAIDDALDRLLDGARPEDAVS